LALSTKFERRIPDLAYLIFYLSKDELERWVR